MSATYPYADRVDLVTYGIPATALGQVTTTQQDGALAAAAAFMDSKFRGRYALPLVAWGVEIVRCCAHIAAEDVLTIRGFNPENPGDQAILVRANNARTWLDQVQRSAAHPDVTPQASATGSTYNAPKVISSSVIGTNSALRGDNRGW